MRETDTGEVATCTSYRSRVLEGHGARLGVELPSCFRVFSGSDTKGSTVRNARVREETPIVRAVVVVKALDERDVSTPGR
jgi:hypothetical protein